MSLRFLSRFSLPVLPSHDALKAADGTFWALHRGRWNTSKLYLRFTCVPVSIVLLGVSIQHGFRLRSWALELYTGGPLAFYFISWWFTLPVIAFATIVDCTELTLSTLRKRNPGVHPGWHISSELVLFVGNLVSLVLLFLQTDSWAKNYDYLRPHPPRDLRDLAIAVEFFLTMFSIIRLALFIIACIDTNRYRTAVQVDMIMRMLRQQNTEDPSVIAANIHSTMYPPSYINHHHPAPLAEPPYSEFVGDVRQFDPKLLDNHKFLASDMPPRVFR